MTPKVILIHLPARSHVCNRVVPQGQGGGGVAAQLLGPPGQLFKQNVQDTPTIAPESEKQV